MGRPVGVTSSYRVYKNENVSLRRCPGREAGGYWTQGFEQTGKGRERDGKGTGKGREGKGRREGGKLWRPSEVK